MLDPTTAERLIDDILATDRTLIVVTHDPTHLDRFDAVLDLRDGRVRHAGPLATAG
jgi:ABC-type transport system involved in cytochrome bd biosynthesis fused ATPase/permease subunit